MSDRFKRVPHEEQERIIRACLEEFSEKEYQRASTNRIVKKAGIPKGTLFYYFGSKKQLFLYVLDRAVGRYANLVNEFSEKMPEELFERLLYRAQVKLKAGAADPILYRFFHKVFLDVPESLNEEMAIRFRKYASGSAENLLEGVDRSRFRDGVDVETAVRMIHLMLDGLLNKYADLLKDTGPEESLQIVDAVSVEIQEYFRMIREGIYR